jgi:prophage regulatory protein
VSAQEAQGNALHPANLKLVGIRKVCDLTSLSRATIYRLIDDGKFPRGLKISSNRIAWRERAVLEWIVACG